MRHANWPFDQPANCAVVTIRSIVFGGAPILHVTHDADDHGWQFLGSGDAETADASVVALSEIVEHDPSVLQLADLPPGWHVGVRPSLFRGNGDRNPSMVDNQPMLWTDPRRGGSIL